MRIVYMGTPEIAAVILERLLQEPYEFVLAVTQPDRPKGRGKALACSPVKEAAHTKMTSVSPLPGMVSVTKSIFLKWG